ncbi:hypothetical protein Tco_1362646 [Tanacetum coccineum]
MQERNKKGTENEKTEEDEERKKNKQKGKEKTKRTPDATKSTMQRKDKARAKEERFQVKKKRFFQNFMTISSFGIIETLISFAIISYGGVRERGFGKRLLSAVIQLCLGLLFPNCGIWLSFLPLQLQHLFAESFQRFPDPFCLLVDEAVFGLSLALMNSMKVFVIAKVVSGE